MGLHAVNDLYFLYIYLSKGLKPLREWKHVNSLWLVSFCLRKPEDRRWFTFRVGVRDGTYRHEHNHMWTSWCDMNVKEIINGRKPISILLHSVNILITVQKRFSTVHSSWEHQHYYSNSVERKRPHSQLQGVKSFIHLIQLDPQQPLHGNKHSVQLENTSHPLWKRDRLNLSEKKREPVEKGKGLLCGAIWWQH